MLRHSRTRTSRIIQAEPISASGGSVPKAARLLSGLACAWVVLRWLWAIGLALAALALTLDLLFANSYAHDTLNALSRATSTLAYQIVAGLWACAILSLCAFAAYRAELANRGRASAPYVLRPVRRASPSAYIPHYVKGIYLKRTDATTGKSADDAALAALYTAAAHRRGKSHRWTQGICVFGRPTQGKTRLAWEAMRTALPDWTLLRWRHTLEPLSLTPLRGKRIALWLDDLHEYTNQNEAVVLHDVMAQLEAAGAQVVVVATCRDGEEEIRACKYLEGLVERLTPIRITNITDEAADQLVAALMKVGSPATRESFSQTPGSILLDVQGMRSRAYAALPEDARQVLRALKLLRSARIFTYPADRVRATTIDVFGMAPAAWPEAVEALHRAGFVRCEFARRTGECSIAPVATAYLDVVVPEYLSANAEPGDDWPWLQESLERRRDGEALLALGNAYAEQRIGPGIFLLGDPATTRLQSAMCFRAALDVFRRGTAPYVWAVTQANLAASLSRLAELAQGIHRTDLRRQSAAAYRAALEIFTRETNPASWALTRYSLAELYHRRAADAVYLGQTEDACDCLRQAWRHTESALLVYSRTADPAHHRQVTRLRSSILDAMGELDCLGDDGDD